MRIACLLVPDLPLRAELRAHPELAGTPLVVSSGPEARAEVVARSPEAAAAGIQLRCSIAQARSMCSELRSVKASPALERAARETLLDVALSLSPRAALAPRAAGVFASAGAVFLDASGIRSLFPSEAGFAAALGARAEKLGLPGVVAMACSRSVAQLAARQLALAAQLQRQEAVTCILPPGSEADFLAPLPIDLLDPGDELAQTLTRFGVHSVSDLLRLPRRGLAQRLGPEVLELIARARGEENEPPLPQPHATDLEEAIDLEYPIEQLEPLSFVLRGLLSRLGERLAVRGLACASLDLGLDLSGRAADGGHDARRIGTAAPTRDIRVLLRLICLDLEQNPPRAPIEGLSLRALGLPLRSDQLDLFRPRGPDPVALDQALAELESLCGAGQVGAPATSDDHRPNLFRLEPFSRSPAGHSNTPPRTRSGGSAPQAAHSPSSRLAVRALRPPVRAEVRLCGGHPTSIRSAVTSGRILHAAGPWRTTGRWWSEEERFALDHYDIQVSDGTILRLCFDWVRRDWQIDAIYD
ncbi:MAG: DNA polymerase Y family protein [Deltaproteobacteria bacterium]|nr:DNA polymerase Y family protein [Deltaproteobacteria bacterium]